VPGAATVRYGGQTSCVEARTASGETLIVDAGTGMRQLGNKLARESGGKPGHYHVLLSHVHWDHIQGLPFFEPAYTPGTTVEVYALLTAADELQQVIGGITRHEFFPVPLEAVPAEINFHEVDPGLPMFIEDVKILPFALNHPFGSVGYRLDADGTSVAYVSDTAPFTDVLHKQHFLSGLEQLTDEDRRVLADMRSALVLALKGCDTVIYDTHFLPEEYARFPHYGHSTPDQALEIVAGNDVRRLILYHHAPSHTDDQMDEIAARYKEKGAAVGVDVLTACEGMVLKVGPREPRAGADAPATEPGPAGGEGPA
jgi:phosphoribosyl 1,2-cyclic phosphodiesterase